MPIMDTSEQPDTAKGKNMAQTKKLVHEGNIIKICVLAFIFVIAAWTAWAAYLGYSGIFPHLKSSANMLFVLSGIQFTLFIGGIFISRKM